MFQNLGTDDLVKRFVFEWKVFAIGGCYDQALIVVVRFDKLFEPFLSDFQVFYREVNSDGVQVVRHIGRYGMPAFTASKIQQSFIGCKSHF